ncbi:MAG: hypothetical protein HY243_02030 [Proteobacteria bacterium]|nr:hypothetical protein [Pseudomonadota bacterium]
MNAARSILAAAFTVSLTATGANAADGSAKSAYPMDCKIGPVEKNFGATQWLVYSCSDGKSLLFVSAANSPASPFYFSLTPERLFGEGTGDKDATDRAYADIEKLNEADVSALVQATLNVTTPQ